jgi:7-keto-8-aminopelargonate synthetase-like enzyme
VTQAFLEHLTDTLAEIEADGLYKRERLIATPQSAHIRIRDDKVQGGEREMVNLCANNYLGLADDPEIIGAARTALEEFGFGMASVRFICGAQTLHRRLEERIASWLGKDDAILFAAAFDANGGLFEPLLGAEDAIISDALNHASIIDGIRLCKAKRYRFANSDMNELEDRLKEADRDGARFKLIATDGVFSMDGYVAKLPETYLFSNSLAPPLAAGALKAIDIVETADDRRAHLTKLVARFRAGLAEGGFEVLPGETPIIPVMLHEARRAQEMAAALDRRGVYVAGFFFPVVPKGRARIRTQMSAALSEADVNFAVRAFREAGREIGVVAA